MKLILVTLALFAATAHAQTFTVTPGGGSSYDACEGFMPSQERINQCADEWRRRADEQSQADNRQQLSEQYARQALNELVQERWIDSASVATAYSKGYTTLQIVERANGLKAEDGKYVAGHPGVKHTCFWVNNYGWSCTPL
jgi:Spy/CpxP family protein refolding chaperone